MARVKNISRTGALYIVFLILFLLCFYIFGSNTTMNEGTWRNIFLLLIVLVPCVLWSIFFYLQDRIEPEPTVYVIVAFLAGMAGFTLIGLPLEKTFFQLNEWMYKSTGLLVLGSIFVNGAITSFLFYILIRYCFYPSREFDEPVDGMIYGAFIGSGFAMVKSLNYLSAYPDYSLFVIAYTATKNILIYASIASLIGYFLGKAKFAKKRTNIVSIVGFMLGTVLIGLYHILNEIVMTAQRVGNIFLLSFILSLLFAIIILAIVYFRMRKLTEKDLHKDVKVKFELNPIVIVLFIIFLIIGGFTKKSAISEIEFINDEYSISFQYPNSLSRKPPRDPWEPTISTDFAKDIKTLLRIGGDDKGSFIFAFKVKKGIDKLSTLNYREYIGDIDSLAISKEKINIGMQEGIRFKYSYPKRARNENFPRLFWVNTDIIPTNNNTYIFTFRGTPENFKEKKELFEDILQTVKWF
ncbi:MAG: PrsW family intramembrane metalloprotease [Candidatus Cloacimonetes bacterium]|nr:PrsW family intramembrane metalloprotease [Candidatus Cloacimonadota bacterium]